MRHDSISRAAPFMLQTNFSTSVRGGIYHFNPRLAQRVNVRVSFISQPGNRWSGQTGDAHSPAAIVLQPSCPKSPVMNKGSLSEQHLLQPLSASVLQMSFGRDKSAFLSGRYWIREAKKAGVIFNLFSSMCSPKCSRSERPPAHTYSRAHGKQSVVTFSLQETQARDPPAGPTAIK